MAPTTGRAEGRSPSRSRAPRPQTPRTRQPRAMARSHAARTNDTTTPRSRIRTRKRRRYRMTHSTERGRAPAHYEPSPGMNRRQFVASINDSSAGNPEMSGHEDPYTDLPPPADTLDEPERPHRIPLRKRLRSEEHTSELQSQSNLV